MCDFQVNVGKRYFSYQRDADIIKNKMASLKSGRKEKPDDDDAEVEYEEVKLNSPWYNDGSYVKEKVSVTFVKICFYYLTSCDMSNVFA